MKHGPEIAWFLSTHGAIVKAIKVNCNPNAGYLRITLTTDEVKLFDRWDEQDQALFGCLLNGEPWDPSKRGLPKILKMATDATAFELKSDKPLDVTINQQTPSEWGERISPDMWKKKPAEESKAASSSSSAECKEDQDFGFGAGFLDGKRF